MTINQITYFLSVYKHSSISKAADELFVSRPVVSRALHDYENELGFKLFTRSNNSLKPTKQGTAFWYMLDEFYRVYNLTLQRLQKTDLSQDSRILRVGILDSTCSWFYPFLYRPFHQVYPDITVYTEGILADDANEKIIDDKLDIAIAPITTSGSPLIGSLFLYNSQVVLCAPKGYKSDGMTSITLAECKNLPMAVLTTLSPPVNEYIRVLSTSQPEMIRIAVSSGYAFSILPHSLVLGWDDIDKIPFNPPNGGALYLLWNKITPHNSAFNDFMDFLKDFSFNDLSNKTI